MQVLSAVKNLILETNVIIDTNREPSSYQDDNYTDTKSEYSRLKQELQELQAQRAYRRKCRTWNWDLEIEFRQEKEHLTTMIQSESGVY